MDFKLGQNISSFQPKQVMKPQDKGNTEVLKKGEEEKPIEGPKSAPEGKPITATAADATEAFGRAVLNQITKKPEKEHVDTLPGEPNKGDLSDYDTWVNKWAPYLAQEYDNQLEAVESFINTANDPDEIAFWHTIKIGIIQNHYMDILNDCTSFEDIPQDLLDELALNMFDTNYNPNNGNLFNATSSSYEYMVAHNGYGTVLNKPIEEMTPVEKRNIMNLYNLDMQMWQIITRIMELWGRSDLTPEQQEHYLECHEVFENKYNAEGEILGEIGSHVFHIAP